MSINRRTLVAGVAVSAALVNTTAAQCVLQQPDAELLALGAELEPILQRRIALSRAEFARVQSGREEGPAEAKQTDLEQEAVHNAMYALADKILAITATTQAGLAVQLRAISATDSELWDNQTCGARLPRYWHEMPPEDARYLAFFESACAVLGVVPVSIEAMGGRS
jgi:hypothetical protein